MSSRSSNDPALTRREVLALPLLAVAADAESSKREWLGHTWRQLHLDAHFGQVANPYADFEPDSAARILSEAGFAMISFFAACGAGYSYYPTNIGVRHPGLTRDYTGGMSAALKKRGVRILPYVSVGPDRRYRNEHPDWVMVRHPAQPAGDMAIMCLNSPWVDEVHIPQLKEIVARYDADGFFLDNLLGRITRGPCYCRWCRESFGADIPTEQDDPRALQVHEFLSRSMARYAEKVTSALAAVRPDLAFVFTHIWVSRNPVKPPACVKQLVWEPAPPYPGVLGLDFSLEGRYLSAQTGIENWSCMATRGNGWGDYSLRDPIAFQHEAATLLAHGGRPYLSDDNYPSGNPDPAVYRVYSAVNQRTRQLESIVQGCEPVPDIAVLLSAQSIWAKLPLTPPRDWMSGPASPAVAGAHKALIEAHSQFAILNSDTLTDRLHDYKALIIPEQCLLTSGEADAVRRFVRDGGALIVSGDSATRDEHNKLLSDLAIADVLGIRCIGQGESRRAYLRVAADIKAVPHMDVQVTGPYTKIALVGAKSLIDLVPPIAAKQAPSARPEGPGISLNIFGKGKAVYCAAPLFTAYHQEGTPALGHLAQWMLETAYPANERTIMLENAPSNLELMYNRRGGTRFVHLVNFTGDKRLDHAQRIHDVSPVGRIRVSVRLDRRPREVLLVPENSTVPFEWRDSKLSFTTSPFALHQIWKIHAEEG